MFIELSSFKNNISNQQNNIEKFHHNCKVEESVVHTKPFRFAEMIKLLSEDEDDEDDKKEVQQSRSNINTYRVWKE